MNIYLNGILKTILLFLLLHFQYDPCMSLNNGLALTPPMGWLAWERFRCNVDCDNDPENCISEKLFIKMADLLVSEGYKDAGYNIVGIDDCWLSPKRDSKGKLEADPIRFPSGIKRLSDYVHAKGLKLGIYEDYGNYTCAGYPGIINNLKIDANTFAEWTVDYIKLDGCYALPSTMDAGYPEFGYYLNKTSRPIVYSCSWPCYQEFEGMAPNYEEIMKTCNLWRNFDDIQDSWESVTSIIDHYATNQHIYSRYHGPGHWNDPDMLIIGNFGLSYEQSKAQMAMWSVFGAPLLMSVDLRTIRPEYKEILLNKLAIKINQDALGYMGKKLSSNIKKNTGIEIWAKKILPVVNHNHSWGIVFLNRRTDGTPTQVSFSLKDLGLSMKASGVYIVTDVFRPDIQWNRIKPDDKLSVSINPTGVAFLHLKALK